MPTPITRTSKTTDLASRYATQHVGASQDAKKAGTSTILQSINAKLYDADTKYQVDDQIGASNFKGVASGGTYSEISRFSTGIDVTPYKK